MVQVYKIIPVFIIAVRSSMISSLIARDIAGLEREHMTSAQETNDGSSTKKFTCLYSLS